MKKVQYNKIEELNDPSTLFDLSGRVGLITGGGGKMGQQFAVTLIRSGAEIVISDRTQEICEKAATYVFNETGVRPAIFKCDVAEEKSVNALFEFIEKNCGRLDFFISNVMAKPPGYYKTFTDYDLETWNRIHDINISGAFLCSRRACDIIAKQKGGSIVITSSIYGIVAPDFNIYKGCSPVENPYGGSDPLTVPGAYASSKGGLIALAKYLSVLFAPKNIRVNVLTPGGVYDGQEEIFHQKYVERTPIGRMGVWSDYNGAVLFLVSDASRYMTGSNLIIDGGWTAW